MYSPTLSWFWKAPNRTLSPFLASGPKYKSIAAKSIGSVMRSRAASSIEYSSTFFSPKPRNLSSVRVSCLILITRSSVSFIKVATNAQSCTVPLYTRAERTAG